MSLTELPYSQEIFNKTVKNVVKTHPYSEKSRNITLSHLNLFNTKAHFFQTRISKVLRLLAS